MDVPGARSAEPRVEGEPKHQNHTGQCAGELTVPIMTLKSIQIIFID